MREGGRGEDVWVFGTMITVDLAMERRGEIRLGIATGSETGLLWLGVREVMCTRRAVAEDQGET